MVKANKKSTSAVSMALMGMINLGKYIFLMMLALLTILLALFISPLLKMFQINKPLMAKTVRLGISDTVRVGAANVLTACLEASAHHHPASARSAASPRHWKRRFMLGAVGWPKRRVSQTAYRARVLKRLPWAGIGSKAWSHDGV